jgi:hypothetical protein
VPTTLLDNFFRRNATTLFVTPVFTKTVAGMVCSSVQFEMKSPCVPRVAIHRK